MSEKIESDGTLESGLLKFAAKAADTTPEVIIKRQEFKQKYACKEKRKDGTSGKNTAVITFSSLSYARGAWTQGRIVEVSLDMKMAKLSLMPPKHGVIEVPISETKFETKLETFQRLVVNARENIESIDNAVEKLKNELAAKIAALVEDYEKKTAKLAEERKHWEHQRNVREGNALKEEERLRSFAN